MSTRSLRYSSQGSNLPKGRMASGSDRDAGAFIEAATIYDSRQQRAIYELVRLLKQYGIWSKMKAIYPFVGGTATTHKWNLKDPQDTDAAFRLTFVGGWTHNSDGIKGNGSTGYAKTFMVPGVTLARGSGTAFIYNRENRDGTNGTTLNDYGCAGAFALLSRYGDVSYYDCWGASAGTSRVQVSSFTDRRGLLGSTRTSNTSLKAFRNGAQIGSTATGTTGAFIGSGQLILSAYNNTSSANTYTPVNYTDMNVAYFCFGDGLTDTEATNLYYAVQRFQQILGRAV